MAEPANYIIVEQGRVASYHERRGALGLGTRLLEDWLDAGPEAPERWMRQARILETLMDDVWAEGCVLLDKDARVLLFHTIYGPLKESLGLRRAYVALLREACPGWDVRWALRDQSDVVDHLGIVPDGIVHDAVLDSAPRTVDEATEWLGVSPGLFHRVHAVEEYRRLAAQPPYDFAFDVQPHAETVVSVRFGDGTVRDFSFGAMGVLEAGPGLLAVLADHAGHPLPNEFHAGAGAVIDVASRRISAWPSPRRPALGRAAGRWEGWEFRWHDEGLMRQATESGRDPDAVRLTPRMLLWLGVGLYTWDRTGAEAHELEVIATELEADGFRHSRRALPRDVRERVGDVGRDRSALARMERYRMVLARLVAAGA